MTYQKTEKEYANLYGKNVRTIRRWKAAGLPLDDEKATRLLLANGGPSAAAALPPAPVTGLGSQASGELGMAAALERLRHAERDMFASYQTAAAGSDDAVTTARWRQWQTLSEALRKAELSNPEVTRENKNSVALADLRRELTQFLARLRTDLDGLPRRAAPLLVGRDEIAIRELLEKETAAIIDNLFSLRYLRPEMEQELEEGGDR